MIQLNCTKTAPEQKLEAPQPNYEELFPFINKPSRYIGQEWNSIKKSALLRENAISVCLCFPDLYETGFANTGIEILYQWVNKRNDAYAERAYAVDTDLARLLRQKGYPLFSLETRQALSSFDIVGFGLPYELCYTNILEMLSLAQIPLRSRERTHAHPLIIAGGPCAVNPEPLADFLDAIVIGDGEEIIGEIVALVKRHKQGGSPQDRTGLLRELAKLQGLYVPALYVPNYHPDGRLAEIKPIYPEAPASVSYRRMTFDRLLDTGYSFPIAPVVPFVPTVHDRLNVEIQRGCPWRCRFCQAGFSYRPYRERNYQELVEIVRKGLENTGYDAVTLAGLSAADHTEIIPLLQTLAKELTPKRISIGLPSTRADRFTLALAEILNSVRRQTITFAPEAGTERMRRVIRKELQESEIRETLKMANLNGWKSVKLYFMYGLPTETQEDLQGIVDLIRASRKDNPQLSLTITLSPFVPKPHTPFQWHAQTTLDNLKSKLAFLRKNLPAQVRAHGLEQIILEGVLSRGDRRCSELLEIAWKKGSVFDEWGERFHYSLWEESFKECGISPEFYCYRVREKDELLPWDHLQGGPDKKALWNDYQTSIKQADEPVPRTPHLKNRPEVPSGPKIILAHEPTVQKVRFKIGRQGAVRFLSHLEQIEMVRRTLRRAQFPLGHSSGFHPQIRCSFGPAISVGYESDCEYFDIELTKRLPIKEAEEKFQAALPQGFRLLKTSSVPLFFPSLESLVNRIEYTVDLPQDATLALNNTDKENLINRFMAQNQILLEKVKKQKDGRTKKSQIDIKSCIADMSWINHTGPLACLFLSLKLLPGKQVKPEKVVAACLNLTLEQTTLCRVRRLRMLVEMPDNITAEV